MEFLVRDVKGTDHRADLFGRLVSEAQDRTDLGNLGLMPERHIGKHAELSFEGGEQTFVDRGVHEGADECGVAPQPIGEGIVFQPLFFEIEREGGNGEAHVDQMGSGCLLSFFGEERIVAEQDDEREQPCPEWATGKAMCGQGFHVRGPMIRIGKVPRQLLYAPRRVERVQRLGALVHRI